MLPAGPERFFPRDPEPSREEDRLLVPHAERAHALQLLHESRGEVAEPDLRVHRLAGGPPPPRRFPAAGGPWGGRTSPPAWRPRSPAPRDASPDRPARWRPGRRREGPKGEPPRRNAGSAPPPAARGG